MSVIVPCFNAGSTLVDAVESALAQTHADLDVVVVDDGSTDEETLRTLEELLRFERVTVIRQPNAGPSAARNQGIRAAGGPYILPLDADDEILPLYAGEAAATLDREPDTGLVYCRAVLFGDATGEWNLPEFSWDRIFVHNMIFNSAMFRKADWESAGGYDESLLRGREDHDFVLRLLSLGRTPRRLEGQYYRYRITSSSRNALFGRDRQSLIDASAAMMRTNLALYGEHADDLFRFIFKQHDEIMDFKHRYAVLERIRKSSPRLVAIFKRARGVVRRARGL